jgi:very-short-patch-repair endonuclease
MCKINSRNLCKEKDCQKCYEKSLASFKDLTKKGKLKIECWSKNNKCLPREVFKGSGFKYNFLCDVCDHEFPISITNMTSHLRWCSYCAKKKLCEKDNCIICYNNSFASFKGKTPSGNLKVDFWSKKNNLNPKEVFKNSNKKNIFDCDNCEHSFPASNSEIIRGNWCPYCSVSPKLLCVDKECKLCYDKSFSSYKGKTPSGNLKINYWNYKLNKSTPRENFKRSGKKFYFDCDICNKILFNSLDNITGHNVWCTCCINKTEQKFKTFFENKYTYKLKDQAKYEWCKDKRKLPFDFSIEELKIIIEIDGEQHFSQVSNWESPENQLEKDLYKMEKAKSKGYTIIRIIQEDIWNDRNNWGGKLDNLLYKYEEPKIFCIGCDKKYKNHIN